MSLKDALTEHANVLRSKTGVSNTLSISDMTRLLNDLSWNKKNLLRGTSDQYRELTGTGFLSKSTASSIYTSMENFNEGDWLTYSATISNTSNHRIQLETWFFKGEKHVQPMQGSDADPYQVTYHSQQVPSGMLDAKVSVSFQKPKNASFVRTYIISQPGSFRIDETIKVKDERLYVGTEPGIWTPNPSDLTGGGRISHSASVMLPFYFSRLEVKVA